MSTAEKAESQVAGEQRARAFEEVEQLHLQALHLQACQKVIALAPEGKLENLLEPAEEVMAARCAQHCGAPDLARRILRRAFHQDRLRPESIYYYARHLWERRGPLAALRFHQSRGSELPGAPLELQADWFALRGAFYAALRDFSQAQHWNDRARNVAPDNLWVRIEASNILEHQDRYEDALAQAHAVLQIRPWYRPAIQQAAQLYQLLGDDARALQLLRDATGHMESAFVLMQLAGLEQELSLYAEARQTIERLPPLMPLMEDVFTKWIRWRKSDLAYWCGDYAATIEAATGDNEPFLKAWRDRLANFLAAGGRPPPRDNLDNHPPHRVRLHMGFVRQHHMTCAPATLSMLCRFWNKPADHLAIADKICYDGTPHHKERQWAEDAGYVTREFTLTWDIGVELISRGAPFALTTVAPERGHAQAVIGYDAFRKTFLIRDPYSRSAFEFDAEKTLKSLESTGPRCLLLLPQEDSARLDGISLPDASLYDHLYHVQLALERHDRQAAARALDLLESAAPGHRITLYGRRCLAGYDANRPATLAATEELLKRYPNDANLQLSKLASLRDLARREDRLTLLRDICSQKDANPVFWRTLGEQLEGDARESGKRERLLERGVRRASAGAAYASLAAALWDRRRFTEAFELYRIVACMDERDERYSRAYFTAARHFKKMDEALTFLRERFERFGAKSGAPARTLFGALTQIDRDREAFDVLNAALLQRPDDGELLTFAADACVRYRQEERGMELLARAEKVSRRITWLFSAAGIADMRCRHTESLALWRQVVELDPLCMDAHRAIARLLAECEGRAKAREYLRQEVEKFPHHNGLLNLLIFWEREEDFAAREATVRRLLTVDGADAWAHRELALILSDAGRDADALAEAEQGRTLEPDAISTANVMATVHERGGRIDEARKWSRKAIEFSVDNAGAMNTLMRLCASTEERRAELKLIQKELIRQVIFGDGLLAFRQQAARVLDPPEVLAQLREAHEARPDLWQSWSALIQQLSNMDQVERAERLATAAVERLPLVSNLFVDLAQVHAARGNLPSRRAALEEAIAISPNWTLPARMLATVHETRNDLPAARRVLEQAVAREPLEAYNHAYLSHVLWKLGEKDAALERLDHAIRLAPHIQNNWESLNRYCTQMGKPDLALTKLRDMARERAGDPAGWRRLATVLPRAHIDEALKAVDQAIELEPRNPHNHDIKAMLLAGVKRFSDAELACLPPIFAGNPPPMLRARQAWLLAEQRRTREAVAAMEVVLAVDQSNYWAWQRLADWKNDLRDAEGYMKVCKRIAELWPHEPGAIEYLAHARLLKKDPVERRQAKEELARVLQLDPDRGFAADRLLSLQLEDRQFDEAAKTIKSIRQQTRHAAACVAEGRLALLRDESKTAVKAMRELATTPTARSQHFTELLQAAGKGKILADLEEAILNEAGAENASSALTCAAISIHGQMQRWNQAFALVRVRRLESLEWNAAVHELLRQIGRHRHSKAAADAHREFAISLAKNDILWGMTGYALCAGGRWSSCDKWMSDFQGRRGLESWMLLNLARSRWHLKREADAVVVHRRALELAPDHGTDAHKVWLACAQPELFAHHANPADLHLTPFSLDTISPHNLQNDELLAFDAARVLVAIQKARHAKRRIIPKDLAPAWGSMGNSNAAARKMPLIKQLRRRATIAVLRNTTNPGLWLKALSRLLNL